MKGGYFKKEYRLASLYVPKVKKQLKLYEKKKGNRFDMFHILDIHIMLITCETYYTNGCCLIQAEELIPKAAACGTWVGVRVVAGQECIQTGTSQKHTKTSLDTSGGPWEKSYLSLLDFFHIISEDATKR